MARAAAGENGELGRLVPNPAEQELLNVLEVGSFFRRFVNYLFSYSAGQNGERVRRNGARSGRLWNAQLFRRPRDASWRARLVHAAHDDLRRVGQHDLVGH